MLLTSFLLLHAIATCRLDQVEIPVLHVRPSKILAQLADLDMNGASLKADDAKGVIIADGDTRAIQAARSTISILDVARRRVMLEVDVTSVVDKLTLDSSATVCSNQQWQTSDSDIGITVAVAPRINDDNTVTLFLTFTSATLKSAHVSLRVDNKQTKTFSISKHGVKVVEDFNHLPPNVSPVDPIVRITPTIAVGRADFGFRPQKAVGPTL